MGPDAIVKKTAAVGCFSARTSIARIQRAVERGIASARLTMDVRQKRKKGRRVWASINESNECYVRASVAITARMADKANKKLNQNVCNITLQKQLITSYLYSFYLTILTNEFYIYTRLC